MMISSYIDDNQRKWDESLDKLAFAYNTSTHATTKFSPFYLMYGRQPKIPLDLFSHNVSIDLALTTDEYASNFEKLMKKTYACVFNNRT